MLAVMLFLMAAAEAKQLEDISENVRKNSKTVERKLNKKMAP